MAQPGGRARRLVATENPGTVDPLTPEQQAAVSRHLGLVGFCLRHEAHARFRPRRCREYADLFQEGCLALIETAQRHDPASGAFATLAYKRIRGQLHSARRRSFSLVRLPHHDRRAGSIGPRMTGGCNLDRLSAPGGSPEDPGGESIAHLLYERYVAAVRAASSLLPDRPGRRTDAGRIFRRIAAERLLISVRTERTPLRRIAREESVSIGRACEYEQQLVRESRELFARDLQVRMLVQLAGQSENGFSTRPDAGQLRELTNAQTTAFMQAFASLDAGARGRVLHALISRLGHLEDVARNLYRLAADGEDIALLTADRRTRS